MERIALIGQSHAVGVLDAIGTWRSAAGLTAAAGRPDPRYTDSFQGWYAVDTGGRLFEIEPREEFHRFEGMRISLLTEATTRKGAGCLHDFLTALPQFDAVVSIMFGNEHSRHTLIDDLPAYDFAPYDPEAGGQPIDGRYIDLLLTAWTQPAVDLLAEVRRLAPRMSIIHVPPPPPLRDPAAAGAREVFGPDIMRFGFVRPSLRLKWYRRYVAALRDRLAASGVTVAEPDYAPALEDGFLRPDHAEGLTHGNARYGALVASHLASLLASHLATLTAREA